MKGPGHGPPPQPKGIVTPRACLASSYSRSPVIRAGTADPRNRASWRRLTRKARANLVKLCVFKRLRWFPRDGRKAGVMSTDTNSYVAVFPLYTQERNFSVRISGAVKGCRTPVADRRRIKLGRQVSDKPRGRKPRAGYAGWRRLLWGKWDRSARLDRTIGFDAVAAIGARWLSSSGEGIVAAVATVDGGLRW